MLHFILTSIVPQVACKLQHLSLLVSFRLVRLTDKREPSMRRLIHLRRYDVAIAPTLEFLKNTLKLKYIFLCIKYYI